MVQKKIKSKVTYNYYYHRFYSAPIHMDNFFHPPILGKTFLYLPKLVLYMNYFMILNIPNNIQLIFYKTYKHIGILMSWNSWQLLQEVMEWLQIRNLLAL
jgi:hypothetical protein